MKNLYFILALFLSTVTIAQTSYYLDQANGDDSKNGKSLANAFKTIDTAVSNLSAGDTLFFVGEFHNESYDDNYTYNNNINDAHIWHQENTIRINNLNGSANNYITFKNYDENTILKGDGANIVRVTNSSYLRFEGLNIEGEVNNIPTSTALDLQFLYRKGSSTNTLRRVPLGTTPAQVEANYSSEGSLPKIKNCKRPSYTDTRGMYLSKVHHIQIVDNKIHHMPGGGLRVSDADYVEITNNKVHNNSRKSYSGTHGLVVTNALSFDNSNATKITITQNEVYKNYNEIYSWSPSKTFITPRIDEGKGISLQKNNIKDNGTPNDSSDDYGWSHGRILVANNLTYLNGFSGIHSNSGLRIDFINNTSYMNSYTNTVTYAGGEQKGKNVGASAQGGNDNKFINNIIVIDNSWDSHPISIANETNIEVKNNLVYALNGTLVHDPDLNNIAQNTTVDNPDFINTTANNFKLTADSPAINNANTSYAPSTDYDGNPRGNNPDQGAYEYIANQVTTPSAPENVVAVANGCDQITITWDDTAADEDGFKIMQKEGNGNYAQIADVSANTTSFTVNDATPDTTYTYKIKAQNSAGSSSAAFSNSTTTPACNSNPGSLTAIGDAFVRNGSYKNTNYGTNQNLQVRQINQNGKKRMTFIKFDVTNLSNTSSALLKVLNTGNNGSVTVHKVTNDQWDENAITWVNKPNVNSAIGTLSLSGADYATIDVTQYINEAITDGFASFALVGDSDNFIKISSKEGVFAPTLVLANAPTHSASNTENSGNSVNLVSLYPNPTRNNANVMFSDNSFIGGTFTITNTLGQTVQKGNINSHTININLQEKSGLYYVTLQKDTLVIVKRLIKL